MAPFVAARSRFLGTAGQKHPYRKVRTTRLQVEYLEDRIVPAFAPAIGSPLGLPATFSPHSVAAVDLNNDGKLDLVFGTGNSSLPGTLAVRIGQGDGTFQDGGTITLGASFPFIRSVIGADLDGDGKLDLVSTAFTSNPGRLAVSQNTTAAAGAAPTFAAPLGIDIDSQPFWVTAADLDGDHKLDLIVATFSGTSSINILRNTSTGPGNISFDAPIKIAIPGGPRSVVAADFNSDGKLDLATANFSNATLSIFTNASSGAGSISFGAPATVAILGSSPMALVTGDFNGDTLPDLAVASFNSSGKVYTVLNQGGTFSASTSVTLTGTMPINAAAADYNGDGKLDLAVVGFNSSLSVLYGNGSGGFAAPENYLVGSNPRWVTQGDFNRDGAPDLVDADSSSNTGTVLLNQAAASSLRVAPDTATPVAGASFSVTVTAQANGSAYQNYVGTVNLTSDDPLAPILGTHTFTPADHGRYTFNVSLPSAQAVNITASDGSLVRTTQVTVVNPATEITPLPPDTISVAYNQTITPSGGTGPYTRAVSDIQNAIPGLNVPSSGTDSLAIDGTPSATGTMVFSVTSTDSLGGTTVTTYSVTVNPAIAISPASLPADTLNIAYNQVIWTSDGGTGAVTLTVSNVQNAIPGLVVPSSGNTIAITGAPTATGTETFTVTATDSLGATATANYSITVNPAVALSPSTLPADTIGVAYNRSIAPSGGTGSVTLTLGAVSNAIAGLNVVNNGTSIAITGTPTATGTETFSATATDSLGSTTTVNYCLVVNAAPTLSSLTTAASTTNVAYTQTITASNGTGTLTLAVSNMVNAIPGLNLPTSGTGNLAITGTPTAAGTMTFTVTATDLLGVATNANYSITVRNPVPTLSNVSITPVVGQGNPAALTGNINGPANQPFTLVVNWGDGSAAQTFNYPSGATTFSENHTYSTPATNIVRVTVGESEYSNNLLYGSTGGTATGQLFVFDLDNGKVTLVGNLPSANVTEIASNPATGLAWLQLGNNLFKGQQFTISSGAAIGSQIADSPSENLNALTFIGNTLYASGTVSTGGTSPSDLRILDPVTGTSTLIGATGVNGPISGMAYNPATGILYGIKGGSVTTNNLVTINLTTGAATTLFSTNFAGGSLAFGTDGQLYAGSSTGQFFRINLATQAVTPVGATGLTSALSGLTTGNDVAGVQVVVNASPTASAGGPYSVSLGNPLTLNATASDPENDTLSYSWDVNGDGVYGDAVGANPTLSWAQLDALGVANYVTINVRVQVTDTHSTVTSDPAVLTITGPYASTGIAAKDTNIVAWANSVAALVRGPQDISNPALGNASYGSGDNALGTPDGDLFDAQTHVVSLGDGGSITLGFQNPIRNGSGADLVVFENGFSFGGAIFGELGFVEASSEGVHFFRFPSISLMPALTQVGSFDPIDPTRIHNLAGQFPALQGTPFDLQDLAGVSPFLDVEAVKYVRIVDAVGSINPAYSQLDSQGHAVNDPWPTPFASSGFDLDAIGVLHEQHAPVASANGPYTVSEGGSLTLNATATDADGDTLSYSWDVNGDGIYGDAMGVSPTLTWSQLQALNINDGPTTFDVKVRVSDGHGNDVASTPATLNVVNTAPTLSIAGPSSINEGAIYTLALSSGGDPGTDTISGWTINWGDGTPVQNVVGNPSSVTHVFAAGPNNYTISATATDEDATYSAGDTVAVSVNHVAPVVSIAGPATVSRGAIYTLSLSGSVLAPHVIDHWTITWGDGTAPQLVSGDPSFVTHVYAIAANNFVIQATASDDVATFDAANTVMLNVTNATPLIISISGPTTVNEGTIYTLSLSSGTIMFFTTNSNLSFVIQVPTTQWSINWGDGTPTQIVTGNPSSVTHVYTSGPHGYTISATATTSTGTYNANNTVAVGVAHVPPKVALTGATSVAEGAMYTLNMSATVFGGHAINQWRINWGDGSAVETVAGNATSATHVYAKGPKSHTISATAADDVSMFNAPNRMVSVTHVAPTLSIAGASSVNEGSTYTLNLNASVVAAHAITKWSINWGDGSAVHVVTSNPATVNHVYRDGTKNYKISATATDDVATFKARNTVIVTVNNVAPTLAINGAASVDEKAVYTLGLLRTDHGLDTISKWTIFWGDGTAPQIVNGNPTSATHKFAMGPNDYAIAAMATDEDGIYLAGNTVAVTVNHVPPTLSLSGAASVNEMATYKLKLSGVDTHPIRQWTINWGDGTAPETVFGNPTQATHVFAVGPNNYNIIASATDSVGTYNASQFVAVSVKHVAPKVTFTGASSVAEGAPYALTLFGLVTGNHPIDRWTITWGDGTLPETVIGNPTTTSHVYAFGPRNYTITATATDDVGTYAANTNKILKVTHVAPTLAINGAAEVNEGSTYVLNLSSIVQPGHAISRWNIHWGDGSLAQVVNGNPLTVPHVYKDGLNHFTIRATATDDAGTFAVANTVLVTVNNVAPTLTLSGAASVNEGAVYTLNLGRIDPGTDTLSKWVIITWGDGTVSQTVAGSAKSVTHVYAKGPNTYTIMAAATDEDGTYNAGNTVTVTVNHVPPTLTLSGPTTVASGAPYALKLAGIDRHAITNWSVNWGDGNPVQLVTGNPSSVQHVFAAGANAYMISATATDDVATYNAGNSVNVLVHQSPSLSISGPSAVDEGSSYRLNLLGLAGSANFPITKWTITWGDGAVQTVTGNPTTVNHTYADGMKSLTIKATATDSFGTYNAGNTVSLTVNNVAPTLTISGAPTAIVNTNFVLHLAKTDPGADTIARRTINWGDGTLPQVVTGNPTSVIHKYTRPGHYTISATATDEDGTFLANTLTLDVS